MTIIYPTLYALDTMGRKRLWYMMQEGPKHCTVSGLVDGDKVTSAWTICKPKNTGKANATTAEEQANAEILARYKKRKKEGYAEEGEEPTFFIAPMLAKKYTDRLRFIVKDNQFLTPAYAQPKSDGIRCVGTAQGLYSRTGERIVSCKHIEEEVAALCKEHGVVVDGELYNHAYKNDFEELASLIRKTESVNEEHWKKTEAVIQYHVYDCIIPDSPAPFSERYEHLFKAVEKMSGQFLQLVETVSIANVHEFDAHYERWLEDNYEGAMLRLDTQYEFKRSNSLLKRKEMQDAEFEIVEILEGDGNRDGMAGAVLLWLPDKSDTFKADLCGGWEKYKRIWEERARYPGKQATVTFQNYTAYGKPRFPKIKDLERIW